MWIESHQELARHPKTRKLSRILEISVPTAIGHLHLFWWWAMDYAEYGNLSRYDAYDIADAAMWERDADVFLTALIKAGFVDDLDGELVIHDFLKYMGKLLEKREKDKLRKQEYARKQREALMKLAEIQQQSDGIREESQGYPEDFQRNSDGIREESHRNINLNIKQRDKDKRLLSGKPDRAEDYAEIVGHLNYVLGTKYKPESKSTRENINGRMDENFTVEDFKTVIDKKAFEWRDKPDMAQYLRPETLFCKKHFESYLNQPFVDGRKESATEASLRKFADVGVTGECALYPALFDSGGEMF